MIPAFFLLVIHESALDDTELFDRRHLASCDKTTVREPANNCKFSRSHNNLQAWPCPIHVHDPVSIPFPRCPLRTRNAPLGKCHAHLQRSRSLIVRSHLWRLP